MDEMEKRLQALEERLAKVERLTGASRLLSPIDRARRRKARAMLEYQEAKEVAAGIPAETVESLNADADRYRARAERLRAEATTGA